MELRQLRYFVAVADTLSFSRASESLYVSQSALSKQIADLEQELGVLLLERDRRNVRLTRAGELLLPEAKTILIRSEKLVPLLRHETDPAPTERSVHIAVESRAEDYPAVHQALTDAVCCRRRQLPGLRALFWRKEYPDIMRELREGTTDLGVFLHTGPDGGDLLDTRVLREDELVLVFRSENNYADNREQLLSVLSRRGLILPEKDSRTLSQVLALLDAVGSAPQIRFCRDRTAMILTMESGESTAILPLSVARRLTAGHLHILSFRHPAARLYLLAAWRKDTDNALPRLIAEDALCETAEQRETVIR